MRTTCNEKLKKVDRTDVDGCFWLCSAIHVCTKQPALLLVPVLALGINALHDGSAPRRRVLQHDAGLDRSPDRVLHLSWCALCNMGSCAHTGIRFCKYVLCIAYADDGPATTDL